MPVRTYVDVELGIACADATGILSLEDVLASLPQMLADPGFRPGMPQLFDLTEAEDTTLTAEQMRQVVGAFQNATDRIGSSRLAIAASDPMFFGVARQYEAIAHPLPTPIRVVRSREEAIAWLLGGENG